MHRGRTFTAFAAILPFGWKNNAESVIAAILHTALGPLALQLTLSYNSMHINSDVPMSIYDMEIFFNNRAWINRVWRIFNVQPRRQFYKIHRCWDKHLLKSSANCILRFHCASLVLIQVSPMAAEIG